MQSSPILKLRLVLGVLLLSTLTHIVSSADPISRLGREEQGLDVSGVRLGIRMVRETQEAGQTVIAVVSIENTRNHPLAYFGAAPAEMNFDCFVVDRAKNVLQRNGLRSELIRSAREVSIPPHSRREWQIPLERHFDLSQPGEYLVYAKHKFPEQPFGGPPRFPRVVRETENSEPGRPPKNFEVTSGNAVFQILAKPGASQTNEPPGASSGSKIQKANAPATGPDGARANPASPNTKFRDLAGSRAGADSAQSPGTPATQPDGTPATGPAGQLAAASGARQWERRDTGFAAVVLLLLGAVLWLLMRKGAAGGAKR